MKAPENADKVELNITPKGYKKKIGKCKNGNKKTFYLGHDLATAKVKAWKLMQAWDTRPNGVECWEDVARHQKNQQEGQKWKEYGAWLEQNKILAEQHAAKYVLPTPPPLALLPGEQPKPIGILPPYGLSLELAKDKYLGEIGKRIGLIGSLGIIKNTYDITEYRIERALAFIPSDITHLNQMDNGILQTLIYALASRPPLKPNPKAKKKVKGSISQATAIDLINAVKSFLIWCDDDDNVGYRLPKKAKESFRIRPEAEEQQIRVIENTDLKTLWDNCINQNAHGKDKGEKRRLYMLLGLNCGFYQSDICTLKPEHIIRENDGSVFIWRLRRKTRKTNNKLIKTKWYLWTETVKLLDAYTTKGEYLLQSADGKNLTPNNISMAWKRLTKVCALKYSFSNLRDTLAVQMERIGGRELADTALAHARKGVIDSYSHPDWQRLSNALKAFGEQLPFPVSEAQPAPPIAL